jgi:hypothetical protein
VPRSSGMSWLLTDTWSTGAYAQLQATADQRRCMRHSFDLKSNSSTQIIPDQKVINVGTVPYETEIEA